MSVASNSPFIHTTPAEAVSQLTDQTVEIGGCAFQISYPGNADQLLDHPSTQAAFNADEYMPYWAELWPAAHMLGTALVAQQAALSKTLAKGATALEIGCGVGLPGIVALSLGYHVIFSDYDATAVDFATRNATANGLNNFKTLPLDWRTPPDFQVPLILAADVIYEERNIEPLVAFIQTVLSPTGICLLSDPDRSTKGGFCYALKQAKLQVKKQKTTAPGPNGRVVTGTIYRIHR
ncbi:MAG: 50S ribosomal protein L11 methyltransferase [Phormidesmis sp.]